MKVMPAYPLNICHRNVPYGSQSTAVGIVTAASYCGTALAFGISPMIISNLGWHVRYVQQGRETG